VPLEGGDRDRGAVNAPVAAAARAPEDHQADPLRAIIRDEVARALAPPAPAENGDRLSELVDALLHAQTAAARRAGAEALADAIERRPATRRRGYVVFVLLRATERRR
jgi:hypothetical protein